MNGTISHVALSVACLSGALASGCGPRLRPHAHTTAAYRSTRACSQGPFVIDLPAAGTRWGEQLVIKAWSPRVIQGRYDITVDGKVVTRGTFGKKFHRYRHRQSSGTSTRSGGWEYDEAKAPENSRCVTTSGAQPTAVATPGGDAGDEKGSSGKAAAPPRAAVTAPTTRPVILLSRLSRFDHEQRRRDSRRYLRFDLLNLDLDRVSIPGDGWCKHARRSHIKAKAKVRIRLWSETPNDLEGAWFEVSHNVFRPTVDEAKFVKYLDEQEKKCMAKLERDARKRRRRTAKRPRKRRRNRCQMLVQPIRSELRYYFETKRMDCSCREKNRSTKCWGKGGYTGYLKRLARVIDKKTCTFRVSVQEGGAERFMVYERKPCRCARSLTDRRCWGTGGYAGYARARWQQHRQRARLAAERRRQAHARRQWKLSPPPTPRAEKKTPRPSTNAVWVPGYWLRIKSGPRAGRWGWIAGWWRVPQTDLRRGLTTRARRRPPTRRGLTTRPPKPAPHAIWAPGYWHWTGARFVWVPGAWRIPPRGQLRWRPARWVRRGPFLVLVPGGWIR